MAVPDYGALPLAKFFLLMRLLSLIAMISIVGMTANFVAEIVSTNYEPPKEVIGALSIVRLPSIFTTTLFVLLQTTNTTLDLYRNPLHLDQHPILLRPCQPRPLDHDRHR